MAAVAGCSLLHWGIILFSYWLLLRGFPGLRPGPAGGHPLPGRDLRFGGRAHAGHGRQPGPGVEIRPGRALRRCRGNGGGLHHPVPLPAAGRAHRPGAGRFLARGLELQGHRPVGEKR